MKSMLRLPDTIPPLWDEHVRRLRAADTLTVLVDDDIRQFLYEHGITLPSDGVVFSLSIRAVAGFQYVGHGLTVDTYQITERLADLGGRGLLVPQNGLARTAGFCCSDEETAALLKMLLQKFD